MACPVLFSKLVISYKFNIQSQIFTYMCFYIYVYISILLPVMICFFIPKESNPVVSLSFEELRFEILANAR